MLFLGIDTSCYTTSVALVDESGQVVSEARRLLTVKPGGRGLAQSEMVFQHTRNLPIVFKEALAALARPLRLQAVAASAYPRPLAGSYMPAFLTGLGYAETLAAVMDIPLYTLSHQENHIFAGICSAGGPHSAEFLAVHVSGGTTEIVKVKRQQHVEITCLGGSLDLHAGQLVDRVGVMLGLSFPAGPQLEQLAAAGHAAPSVFPRAAKGLSVSFSGPETHAKRLLDKEAEPAAIAAGLEDCVADAIFRMTAAAMQQTGLTDVLMVGGVMSNAYIRRYVTERLATEQAVLYFPAARFSSDNASGAAYFAYLQATQTNQAVQEV